jgi:DNA mismatch repair protein MutL
MGRDFALSLLPIEGRGGEVEVRGFVTKPLHCHGSRGKQVLFVNGRFIKSQLLTAALEEAYKNQMMKGRFPGCVLHVTLPPEMVDVNVHPAKTVVKFVSDKTVFDALYYTVRDALDAENKPAAPAPKQESFYQTMTVQQYKEAAAPKTEEKKPLGSYSYTTRPIPAVPVAKKETLHGAVQDVQPRQTVEEKGAVPHKVEEKAAAVAESGALRPKVEETKTRFR